MCFSLLYMALQDASVAIFLISDLMKLSISFQTLI